MEKLEQNITASYGGYKYIFKYTHKQTEFKNI